LSREKLAVRREREVDVREGKSSGREILYMSTILNPLVAPPLLTVHCLTGQKEMAGRGRRPNEVEA
jgi:hypothetical protein